MKATTPVKRVRRVNIESLQVEERKQYANVLLTFSLDREHFCLRLNRFTMRDTPPQIGVVPGHNNEDGSATIADRIGYAVRELVRQLPAWKEFEKIQERNAKERSLRYHLQKAAECAVTCGHERQDTEGLAGKAYDEQVVKEVIGT
jgi:hypothetical protein